MLGYGYCYHEVDVVTVKADGLTIHVLHYPVDMRYSVLIFQVQSTQRTSSKGHGEAGS